MIYVAVEVRKNIRDVVENNKIINYKLERFLFEIKLVNYLVTMIMMNFIFDYKKQ